MRDRKRQFTRQQLEELSLPVIARLRPLLREAIEGSEQKAGILLILRDFGENKRALGLCRFTAVSEGSSK